MARIWICCGASMCWHADADGREPADATHLWMHVNENSGPSTCYNFHSNSHIIAFFLVFTIYTCICICIHIYISLLWFNIYVDLLQFPFELAHNCIFFLCWPYIHVYISSGALTCYNFHSNSHIVAFFLVFTIYTCIYIYIYIPSLI